jgi:uncharacterized membrane protein YkvA (DUF1232 family)
VARFAQPSVRRKARLAAAARAAREASRPGSASLGARIGAIPRMDAVPELVLSVFGLADDLLLSVMIATSLLSEADQFLEWEAQQATRYVDSTVFP